MGRTAKKDTDLTTGAGLRRILVSLKPTRSPCAAPQRSAGRHLGGDTVKHLRKPDVVCVRRRQVHPHMSAHIVLRHSVPSRYIAMTFILRVLLARAALRPKSEMCAALDAHKIALRGACWAINARADFSSSA